ncbi:FtsX-like permease family protein [Oceanispirochaeta crateris]|uniref:FtsX-like permease family protein n=1 Tax=Oceanispirochaeta crateris TaxID=2518645 RepID=A0A5C1QHD6_9SPIO|nr:FtsX-like permease family protein [Oceanispirochaeta crateris]QEN06981.1 FtsX-like permease family protein [Oceanispirochaeta crateris]
MRNLLRNRRSSFLLLLLVAFITLIFFLGTSLIDQSVRGMRKTYVDNLTGDLIIQKESRVSMNLFGANTPIIDDFFTIPSLPAYDNVKSIVKEEPDIAFQAGLVSGKAVMDLGGQRSAVPLMGVEAQSYFDLFPGINVERGRKLLPGEAGVMITSGRAASVLKKSGNPVEIGIPVRLTSAGKTGFKIQEVPLVGVFSYTNPGPYMEEVVISDPQTVRALSAVLTVASVPVEVSENAMELLDGDLDDLFGGFSLVDEAQQSEDPEDLLSNLKADIARDDDAESISLTGGDWNFLILRLKDGASPFAVQNRLNSRLQDIGVKAVGWQTAAGNSALMILLIQALFYGGMLLVVIAGIVTIINIILISVFKRTREMGTLRSIGASDRYILSLLYQENLILSLLGGLAGVFIGKGLLFYLNSLKWPISHNLIAALMGSPILTVNYSGTLALQALFLAVLLGLLATSFPAWKATRINPMEAVRRG